MSTRKTFLKRKRVLEEAEIESILAQIGDSNDSTVLTHPTEAEVVTHVSERSVIEIVDSDDEPQLTSRLVMKGIWRNKEIVIPESEWMTDSQHDPLCICTYCTSQCHRLFFGTEQ